MSKTVLITGVGGSVGQGILRNIINLNLDICLVGTNTERVSPGNHLCDFVYELPFAYESNYIDEIKKICLKHFVDLIIPSTDYETYYLGINQKHLPIVACSNPVTSKIFLDKYLTWLEFKQCGLPFAESVLPSKFDFDFDEIIIKPREGRGSRSIFINPPMAHSFSDDYVVQKLYKGIELTTSFYINKSKAIHGFITFKRYLQNGTTIKCEMVTEYNSIIEPIIQKINNKFFINGSCNIQSIFDGEKITPFEINCRISGTNSIRAQLGFEDVKYTIEEYLLGLIPTKPKITRGCALRILMDVVYPESSLDDVINKNTNHILF